MPLKTEPFVLNIGPQHPSTHGVFRMLVTLDGEVVQNVEPVLGYLHRGVEKLAEERTFTQCITLTDRCDYLASMTNNQAYVLAAEKLAGVNPPERAEYLRVIMAELMRIASHLMGVGFFLNDLGAFHTPLLYMWREREKILDLFEMVCGQRLTYNYMRIGGLSHDVPPEFLPALQRFLDEMPGFIDEYDQLLAENEILLARTKGVGILPRELAINASAAGPVLRASGVKWDIRKADPYGIYDRFEFEIPTAENGDAYDRYRIKILEMRQSVKILQQAVKQLPEAPPLPKDALRPRPPAGPVQTWVPHLLRPPVGEVYSRIEAPKGELGIYLVSDNYIHPYRFHIRPPALLNITALKEMVLGWKVADLIIIFGSLDINMGEIDR